MTDFSLAKKAMFLHVPKNGGTSIRAALAKIWPDRTSVDSIDERERTSRHPAYANHFPFWLIEMAKWPEKESILECQPFLVIRNPWERMVSLYHHRLRKIDMSYQGQPRNSPEDKEALRQGFNHWLIKTPHPGDMALTQRSQLSWGYDLKGAQRADILRFEHLAEDFQKYAMRWQERVRLPILNDGGGSKGYRGQYTQEGIDHVANYFRSDIDFGRYTF